ncbi:glutaredoxin-C10-like [Actinidia eriantha]|uniref:glutaredoxin-C10-like n=1 Tax=Actinidia eriantha TaxID=165200 RepID=UPI00258473B9|nr:glutaredoxin-C10-like [Actinidia eriantha]
MNGGVRLELTPSTTSTLAIDEAETAGTRIRRLVSENPVVIFSRSSSSSFCCMCDVIKRFLISSLDVHPTIIQLDDDEEIAAADVGSSSAPVAFIGGTRIGGFESLVALHLGGHLRTKLAEAGAL